MFAYCGCKFPVYGFGDEARSSRDALIFILKNSLETDVLDGLQAKNVKNHMFPLSYWQHPIDNYFLLLYILSVDHLR